MKYLICFLSLNNIYYIYLMKYYSTRFEDYIREVEKINLDDFFLETDSPYLAPTPHRGKRKEPSLIKCIADYIANVKQISTKEVIKHTTENALKFFKKMNEN